MPGSSVTQHLAQFYIYANGQLLDDLKFTWDGQSISYMDEVISVEVDDSLYLPDMFTIRLKDRGLEILSSDTFKPGTKIKIAVKPQAPAIENPPDSSPVTLMIGEVTA